MKDLSNYIIKFETDRTVLITLEPKHVIPDYVSWLNDPAINRYLEVRHATHTLDNVLEFVEKMHACPNNLQMGIFLKDNERHIGNIKLGPLNKYYKRADIGLLIGDKACWGKGYATEAIQAVCAIAQNFGLRRVHAGAYASNVGSLKAFEKAGFTQEGLLKGHWLVDGEAEDGLLFGKFLEPVD